MTPRERFYAAALCCKSISLPSSSTHRMAKASSVKRLLDPRARLRMAVVASSSMERASVNALAYSASVLA